PPAFPSWEGAATRNSFSCLAEGRPEQRVPLLWPWSWPRPWPWLSSWAEAPAAVRHRRTQRAAIGLFICPSSPGNDLWVEPRWCLRSEKPAGGALPPVGLDTEPLL